MRIDSAVLIDREGRRNKFRTTKTAAADDVPQLRQAALLASVQRPVGARREMDQEAVAGCPRARCAAVGVKDEVDQEAVAEPTSADCGAPAFSLPAFKGSLKSWPSSGISSFRPSRRRQYHSVDWLLVSTGCRWRLPSLE